MEKEDVAGVLLLVYRKTKRNRKVWVKPYLAQRRTRSAYQLVDELRFTDEVDCQNGYGNTFGKWAGDCLRTQSCVIVSMVQYEFPYFPLNSDVCSLHLFFILKLDNFRDNSGDRQDRTQVKNQKNIFESRS